MIHLILTLLIAAVLAFGGLVLFVCASEQRIPMSAADAGPYGAIIVLGAQVREDGTPSVQLQWRLDAAVEAWTAHPVPIVVCGPGRGRTCA